MTRRHAPEPKSGPNPNPNPNPDTTNPPRERAPAREALAVFAFAAVLTLATSAGMSIVWDEGYTLGRLARARAWFDALRDPPAFAARFQPPEIELVQRAPRDAPAPAPADLDTLEKLFAPKTLEYFWPFGREEPHGHPAFYGWVGLLGDLLPAWTGATELLRARFGAILLYALAAGAIHRFLRERAGLRAGLAGAAAWLGQPRLFAEGHYATYDGILASLAVLACFNLARAFENPDPRARPRVAPLAAFAFLWGCAAATKLTGWLLGVPALAWLLLGADGWRSLARRAAWFAAAVPVMLAVAVAWNPPWWADPADALRRFWTSNLTRDLTINIPVMYAGKVYLTPSESLPWHNSLVLTAIATPVSVLLLAFAGSVSALFDRAGVRAGLRSWTTLFTLAWAFFVALRALPGAPGHDGVRQFLPAFGCLAVLAGLGAARLGNALARRVPRARALPASLLAAECAFALWTSHPVPLGYYSPLVGGPPGAARLGMEPTYYWDGLDARTLEWLNANTPEGKMVAFSSFPTSWIHLARVGAIRFATPPLAGPGASERDILWYVLQNRPGAFSRSDRERVARQTPAWTRSAGGVPLVWVFPYAFDER